MYTEYLGLPAFPKGTGVLGAETVSASVAEHGEYLIARSCVIRRIMFHITTAIAASVTAPVVTFRKRPTPGSATGQSSIGTLTLPDLAAAGKVYYKDVSVAMAPGDALCLDHTTQAVDGSAAAGAGYGMFSLEDSPEYKANVSDLVASA